MRMPRRRSSSLANGVSRVFLASRMRLWSLGMAATSRSVTKAFSKRGASAGADATRVNEAAGAGRRPGGRAPGGGGGGPLTRWLRHGGREREAVLAGLDAAHKFRVVRAPQQIACECHQSLIA